jgi:hypothetical protein
MQTPPLDPDIADTASSESGLTVYDEEHLITYLRLLDADAEGADGREVARLVLHLDPKRKSDRARRTFESHLSRVKWMTEHGYRHLLRGVEYCGRVSRRRTAEITGLKSKIPRSGDGDVRTALLSVYFCGDLLGAIAQAAFKGAHVWTI